MSEIVHDTTHVAQGLAFLTGDNAQANTKNILSAWLAQIQALEDQIYLVYLSRILANAVGAQIDLLGALVGEPRNNRTDAAYKVGIRVRVIVNFSRGTPFDIVAIAVAGAPDVVPYYADMGTGHFTITLVGLTANDDAPTLSVAFQQAKANGTNGDFIYSSTSTSTTFRADTLAGGFVPVGADDYADALGIGKACALYSV